MITQLDVSTPRIPVGIQDICRWLSGAIPPVALFGSTLREDFNADSDYDFLVSFENGMRLDIDKLLDMKTELEQHLGRSADLVKKEALRTPWRKHEILANREVIHVA